MITVQMTNLEAAAVANALIEAANIAERCNEETLHGIYMRIVKQIVDTIASTRAELTEADLLL